MIEEITKYEFINAAESITDLEKAIMAIADENGNIMGREREWDAVGQSKAVSGVVSGILPVNVLTRSYGIRQQAIYLQYYL